MRFFTSKFSLTKSFRNQIAIEYLLAQACTSPMPSKSEKILMSLNSKQKSLCQLVTTKLLPQGDKVKGDTKKMAKARLDLRP